MLKVKRDWSVYKLVYEHGREWEEHTVGRPLKTSVESWANLVNLEPSITASSSGQVVDLRHVYEERANVEDALVHLESNLRSSSNSSSLGVSTALSASIAAKSRVGNAHGGVVVRVAPHILVFTGRLAVDDELGEAVVSRDGVGAERSDGEEGGGELHVGDLLECKLIF